MAGDTTSDLFVPSAHSWTDFFLPRGSIAPSFNFKCIIHKEQAHSIKNVCLQIKADNTPKLRIQRSWFLHFTRKFNLAIPSRFPGSRLIAPLSFSCYGTMDILRFAPLLQWPDRSGFSPDSLFLYCSFSQYQHLICSVWNYTVIIITPCSKLVNYLSIYFSIFHTFRQRIPFIQTKTLSEFCFFQTQLWNILIQKRSQLINPLSGHIVYQKNSFTSCIQHPLTHHWNIRIRRIYFRNDSYQWSQNKCITAIAKQTERDRH